MPTRAVVIAADHLGLSLANAVELAASPLGAEVARIDAVDRDYRQAPVV